ncbi:TrkH family potassium uptake protein [Aerococcaceae bacterium NML180378]|nr:TrkH family potassium uptake protein [Aerococcaceae bacterium NML180378]
MKRSVTLYLIGKILLVEASLLLLPVIVGLFYRESWQQISSYMGVACLVALVGLALSWRKPSNFKVRARDGLVTVSLGWILLSVFGALPLILTGEIPHFVDAFFEIASGFTTTGSSILSDLSLLQHSSLFWRSFTHLVGGMGVLVFTLAILPNSSDYVELMRAEVPGPIFGKLVSKVGRTARILYGIYIAMTFILIVALVLAKVPVFDAMLLAFGTAGTGGFGVDNAGFAIYQNQAAVEWLIGVGMLLFGVNFNVYYFILLGYAKDILKSDEELCYYFLIVIGATALICLRLAQSYDAVEPLLRQVFFTVASLITTTGFATVDYAQWPLVTHIILLALMFIGGCAGSTAGGLKVSRIVMYLKCAFVELKRVGQPKRKLVPMLSGKAISKSIEAQIASYLLVYIVGFLMILLSVSFEVPDFTTAFSSVAATFNNIGPGLGQVGPTANFSFYSNWNKLVLALGMIAGRLEIFPIILLFSPKTIRRLILDK